ncbi:hypothetical protein EV580_2752 [Mycobacterium sp. BK086]|uniref:hypothetical protein n=1 Tax=Mycobacterium sp. BK086 TaxID=2512165 RepID=UPI00105CD04E|nr:hypothetical protein [Mycobacterium sp. BK086]TDO14619.1 hypothetical protein EV580_2752 [Mycobacterium sp. BK086]
MRNYQGGTQKWCPKCETIRVVKSVGPSSLGARSGQRFYRKEHDDIHYFRRGQECQTCWHEWLSAEVPEDFIDELVELREALSDIKENVEAYSKESENAAKSLVSLSKSLSDLRALNIYKKQT